MTTLGRINLCHGCAHLDRTSGPPEAPARCAAFPDEIPHEIYGGGDHRTPVGDETVVFDELYPGTLARWKTARTRFAAPVIHLTPSVIIDETATPRSDHELEALRPVWKGGTDVTLASLDEARTLLGAKLVDDRLAHYGRLGIYQDGPPTADVAAQFGFVASAANPEFAFDPNQPRDDQGQWAETGAGDFDVITADEARGNSRGVTHAEFQRLATIGHSKLEAMAAHASPPTGLDERWEQITADAYAEVQASWGGTTIDSHTGRPVPQGIEAYALTVKSPGLSSVSVPENATRAEFDAAMGQARQRFGPILERQQHHLGVFHDDENQRIDIDPVLVVRTLDDVETIGAATHAIGGAYSFKDGQGYWPVHVASKRRKK